MQRRCYWLLEGSGSTVLVHYLAAKQPGKDAVPDKHAEYALQSLTDEHEVTARILLCCSCQTLLTSLCNGQIILVAFSGILQCSVLANVVVSHSIAELQSSGKKLPWSIQFTTCNATCKCNLGHTLWTLGSNGFTYPKAASFTA